MTVHEFEAAAEETLDRLLLLLVRHLSSMSEADNLDFPHRLHILLGREKQNAIVRVRFRAQQRTS
jgi:hypothetical protein